MVDKQEMRFQAMSQGRSASLVAGYVKPYLDERMTQLVARMASLYRSRQADFPTLLGIAAQVTFCLDMISDLDSKRRKGDQAVREEMNASDSS
jgi:hypothetical protein